MHELLLCNTCILCQKLVKYVLGLPEQVMGSEYALIDTSMSYCPRILKMAESARMWASMPQYV